jgi:serine/threonine-protein kinase
VAFVDPYELVGTTFRGRFELEAFAAVGRFSAVYRAREADTERLVALRVLRVRPELPATQRAIAIERLRGVAGAINDVASQCPAFAGVEEVGGVVSGARLMPTLVQPWAGGETLEAALAADRSAGAMTLARAIERLSPLADALGYAHARGLVHGGLAPRSVFVRRGESSRSDWAVDVVLDLGMSGALAALQAKDRAFGPGGADAEAIPFFTCAYGAPEQFAALKLKSGTPTGIGPTTDLFALALLVVELVTGQAPMGDGDDAQLEAAAIDPAVRPTPRARGRDLGGYVEAVFERALAVQAAERYANVESFWSALRAASRMTLRPSASRMRSAPPPPRPPTVAEAAPPPRPRVPSRPSIPSPRGASTAPPAARPENPRAPIPPSEFFLPNAGVPEFEGSESGAPESSAAFSLPGTNPLFGGDPESRRAAVREARPARDQEEGPKSWIPWRRRGVEGNA